MLTLFSSMLALFYLSVRAFLFLFMLCLSVPKQLTTSLGFYVLDDATYFIYTALKTLDTIVKDQSSHLVYLNMCISQTSENLSSIGRRVNNDRKITLVTRSCALSLPITHYQVSFYSNNYFE